MDSSDSLVDYTDTDVIDRSGTSERTALNPRTERRKPSVRSFIYGALNPRRRQFRRDEDGNQSFLDWYPPHLLVAATVTLSLSIVEGLLTVRLVNAGLQELNPVIAPLVHGDPVIFALIKIALTMLGVVTLVISAQAQIWRGMKAARIFSVFFVGYGCVIVYELYLTQFA